VQAHHSHRHHRRLVHHRDDRNTPMASPSSARLTRAAAFAILHALHSPSKVERLSLSQPAHAERTDLGHSPIKIALLGCGTVGTGVAQLLLQRSGAIASRGGRPFVLAGIAVRSSAKPRSPALPLRLFTTDAQALVDDPSIGMIVECIGGLHAAGDLVERAVRRGKHVVTANKDLLATAGPALRSLACGRGVTIAYEAAVGGAIPIVRTLTGSLAGESIVEVGGVLNGTTNFILDAMTRGATFADALADAQQRGYAEADASSDTSGLDAAHKLAILMQLAFRRAVTTHAIPRHGIEGVTPADVALAHRLGYVLKLVAVARDCEAIVTPAFVHREHPFAQPAGVHNCIRIIGRSAGTLTFTGAGAGREPTASAVIADVIATLGAMRNRPRADDEPLRPCAALRPLALPTPAAGSAFPVWEDAPERAP
jgi:homoserine dehydrogenase